MKAIHLGGNQASCGLTSRSSEWNSLRRSGRLQSICQRNEVPCSYAIAGAGSRCFCLSVKYENLLSPLIRSSKFRAVNNQLNPDCGVESLDGKNALAVEEEERDSSNSTDELIEVNGKPIIETPILDVKRELVMLSLPAIAGQAIDPLALLMETAYIGRLGSLELGSAGVAMSIFNTIAKLFNIPLLSVATSFVAEDISRTASADVTSESNHNGKPSSESAERKQLSSVSTALLLAVGIGMFEALALLFGAGPFLGLMGVSSTSDMFIPARKFLALRALGAPAFVVSLALQGIFRGFKDTKTPVFCLGIGNLLAALLFPLLIYQFRMGVAGAAISTVISQYIVAIIMVWHLNKRVILFPPNIRSLRFGDYINSGGFVLGRTLAVLMTMTVATSLAARQGSVAMAAHQICMQVWLAVSLLTDALAASGQALIASSMSRKDFGSVKKVTKFVLKIGLATGISLAIILGLSFGSVAGLFSKDPAVLGIVKTGVIFVAATQPITALAFIFDGLHFGMSDFPYAACSMMLVGAVSSAFLLLAPSASGLYGVWWGLSLFMSLRMLAGFVRLLWKNGPWWFLHQDLQTAKLS